MSTSTKKYSAITGRRLPPPWPVEEGWPVSSCGTAAIRRFDPAQYSKMSKTDEQEYDDRAQNDYPIGFLISP
jgi:hypothetical protein